MTFAWPWAFLGLLALPALAVIYRLRQRARRLPVSSLLLWREQSESRAGGRRFERFEASRLFLLELLILALLVGAAAGPLLPTRQSRRPLVAVLDDSFSMLAGGERSPRRSAESALLRELESGRHASVTLVAAGAEPQVLGEAAAPGEVAARLAAWRALAAAARLEPAVALAFDLGGDRARILVLSDRAPPEPPQGGRLAWWAFGRPTSNLALVNAVRSPEDRAETSDACLVEVANFSPRPATARLGVSVGESSAGEAERLELAAGEVGRFRFSAPRGELVRLSLTPDTLGIDDRAILLPEGRRSVRVALEIGDERLRRRVAGALGAAERAVISPDGDELVITDAPEVDSAPDGAWVMRIAAEEPAVPYLGPFVLDRGHPLTGGLALDGVIWGAGEADVTGAPVVAAGDVTLLADRETADGRHRLTLRWRPELSTLQRTPNWPILWWNLLKWRADSIPGVRSANLRLGGQAAVGLAAGAGTAELTLPDGSTQVLHARGGRLEVPGEQVGIHRLRHGGRTDRWAVNALAAEESDLRGAASGRWGGWETGAGASWERRGVAWVPLLAAAALLVLHLSWTAPRTGSPA